MNEAFTVIACQMARQLFLPTVAEVYVFTVSGVDRATDGPTIVELALFGRCCKYKKYCLNSSNFDT